MSDGCQQPAVRQAARPVGLQAQRGGIVRRPDSGARRFPVSTNRIEVVCKQTRQGRCGGRDHPAVRPVREYPAEPVGERACLEPQRAVRRLEGVGGALRDTPLHTLAVILQQEE